MSYHSGILGYTTVGAGTITTNAGSSAVTVTRNASVLAGDLVVLVVYAQGDITGATRLEEPWRWLDGGYDSTNAFGLGLFASVTATAGATTQGLTLPASMAWTAQNYTYRPLRGLRWDLVGAVGSNNWFNAAATGTATTRPALVRGAGMAGHINQGINLIACGYNNAGTTTTTGTISNWTERFDTGQAAPPHGITLSDEIGLTTRDMYSTLSASLAVTKTMRAGVRAYIPLINNPQARSHSMSSRRMRA